MGLRETAGRGGLRVRVVAQEARDTRRRGARRCASAVQEASELRAGDHFPRPSAQIVAGRPTGISSISRMAWILMRCAQTFVFRQHTLCRWQRALPQKGVGSGSVVPLLTFA